MDGRARVSLLQLPLSSTQYCTVLASLVRTSSNTILLELHSQCLLVNQTSTEVLIQEKTSIGNGMLQRSLKNNETMVPSSDEVNAKLSLYVGYYDIKFCLACVWCEVATL